MQLTLGFAVAGLFSQVASQIARLDYNKTLPANISALDASFGGDEVHVALADDKLWNSAVCRGSKLLLGMTLNEDQAAQHVTPVNSPWDGTLERELETWGYYDDSHERTDDCDFEDTNGLKTMFDALGIDTRDASLGGPNHCFTVFHWNGPAVERDRDGDLPPVYHQRYTVNGRRYRVTGAHFTIGVNEQAGLIYFLVRGSPEQEARDLWEVESVPRDELPALRSSSDIAWGFWNRRSGHDLGAIKGFMPTCIMNKETGDIIDTALANAGYDSLPFWPGVRFDSGSNEYLALMGSPNGLAAGYFLTQHKRQLGGNKYVSHIIVFAGDETAFPTMLFSVDWAPSPPPPQQQQQQQQQQPEDASTGSEAHRSKAVRRAQGRDSGDPTGKLLRASRHGRQVVREHVVWAE